MIDDSYPVYLLVIAPDIRYINIQYNNDVFKHTHAFVCAQQQDAGITQITLYYINIYIYIHIAIYTSGASP